MSRPLLVPLISRSIESIVCSDRDICPDKTAAILPVSETAAWIASFLSCQIVKPTALTERPSNKIAAHHSRRSGMGFNADGVSVGASYACLMSPAVLSSIPVSQAGRPLPGYASSLCDGAKYPLKVLG